MLRFARIVWYCPGLLLALFVSALVGAAEAPAEGAVDTMLARGDRDGAIRALDAVWPDFQAVPADEGGFERMRSAARNYRTLGVRTRATELLARLAEHAASARSGALPGLLLELGEVQGEAEMFGQAANTWRRLLDSEPAAPERARWLTQFIKAEVRGRDGARAVGEAIVEYEQLLRKNPDDTGCSELLEFAGALLHSRWAARHEDSIARLLDAADALATDQTRHYVLGFGGWLAELSGQSRKAIELSRAAALEAMRTEPATAYRWLWQVGRALRTVGRTDEALVAWREAVRLLGEHRPVAAGFQVFRERVFPVYGGLLELLLLESDSLRGAERQALLGEVRGIIEGFNESEVLDYFAGDCVLPRSGTALESLAQDTAVIYQFVLEDTTVVLARLPDGLHVYRADIEAQDLRALTDEFREALVSLVDEDELNELGEELYVVLFAGLEADLARFDIARLVFVPTSTLRTIPMAALYDGERYLIERFELASTLGLELTDSGQAVEGEIFFGGVSEAVGGFSALPGVIEEIDSVQAVMGGDVLLDAGFTADNAARQLAEGGYSSVHIATHGVFEREVSSSFLLTYDGKLTLHRLQETIGVRRYLGEPIDLLVLSACESAAGDEKAALGLAGVSLKAGARSTLATLWEISDSGTFRLMQNFYQHLGEGKPKGEALRLAQLKLRSEAAYSHPNFWSPYVLIGSWR